MTIARLSPRALHGALALALLAACTVNEAGTIPCADDSSCPVDYPVCSGAAAGAPGKCVSGVASSDGGSAAAAVSIVGVEGHRPSDVVNGTVRVVVLGRASSGVLSVSLAAGATSVPAAADSAPPLWTFDYATTGAGDVALVAKLVPGDPRVSPVTSAPYTLHVDNNGPQLTLAAPVPATARTGQLITLALTSSKPLATLSGAVTLQGSSTQVGGLSILSGALGVDESFTLGFPVPPDAAPGVYSFTATGTDAEAIRGSAAAVTATVFGPFALASVAVTSDAQEGVLPAGKLNSAFQAAVKLPLTVPLGASAAVFTLTDAAGKQRLLGGPVTSSADATSTTLTIADAIASGDANGPAVVSVVVTDAVGNQASGAAGLIIDTVAPFLVGLAPDLTVADPTSGSPAGTVHFTGTASEPLTGATWSILSGGTGSGSCTCNGGSCGGGQTTPPLVSCAVPLPAESAATQVTVAISLLDDVGNASLDADNQASLQALPLPTATSLTPSAVTITIGTSTNLVPQFSGGAGVVVNDRDASVFNVTAGQSFAVAPTVNTTYSLVVTNAVGSVASPAPTSTVTVNQPLTFTVTYVPASGPATPGAIPSGATTGTLSFSIPDLTGFIAANILDAAGRTVTFASGGAAITSGQIFGAHGSITGIQIPVTRAVDVRTLTYTLQLTNAGNGTSNFFANLQVLPAVSMSGAVSLAPAAISGGATGALTLTLPQFSGSTQTVSFTTPDGATLLKAAGGPLTSSDLLSASGGTLSVLPPTSLAGDAHKTDTFTLLASNAASTAAQTAALDIYPVPVLGGSIGVAPGAITGATAPTLTLTLPAITSPAQSVSAVSLTISSGGAAVAVLKHGGGAVGPGDLGGPITVDAPTTSATDSKTFTYTLTASNAAATPATAVATGALTIVPQPVLFASGFTITPAAITGATTPTLSLALPALKSAAGSASAIALSVSSGGASSPVVKSDSSALLLSDLGKSITINAPTTGASDDATYTYTLTVSNSAATPAAATATGALAVVPSPQLNGTQLSPTPAIVTGGTAPSLSIPLPSLKSPVATPANSVAFTVDCGSGPAAIKKSDNSAVALSDLATTITVVAPATSAGDNKSCTFALTLTNAAGASTSASGAIQIVPAPVLASATFTPSPAAINGGSTTAISLPLPAQSSPAASPVNTVALAVNCGASSSAVTKSDGSAVLLTDLGGTAIQVLPPASVTSDNKVCVYTLTLTNAAGASTSATATLNIGALPTLASNKLTLSVSAVTGGGTATFTIALPAVTSGSATPPNTVALTVDCGAGSSAVKKSDNSNVVLGDLGGAPITVRQPTSLTSDNLACTYTLKLSNAAGASASATGALAVVPLPALSPTSFTLSPAVITGGSVGALSLTLPAQSSPAATPANTVAFTVNCGSGSSAVAKSDTTAVAPGDLGNPITINPPASSASDDKSCTYTLTLSNAAGTSATATGPLNIVPTPSLGVNPTLTLSTPIISGGSVATFTIGLPAATGTATPPNTAALVVDCGGGSSPVTKSGGGTVGLGDLGHNITVAPPTSATSDNKACTYTLTLSNAAGAGATATGTLNIVPLPTLAPGGFTLSPAVITGGTTPTLALTLPAQTSATASPVNTVAFAVNCGAGSSTVTKSDASNVVLNDLGKPITIGAPTSTATDNKSCTYTLTLSNAANASTTSTGAINVVPVPSLGVSPKLTLSTPVINGGSAATFTIALPAQASPAATPVNTVALVVDCGSGQSTVNKSAGGTIGLGDLNHNITVNPPTSATGDSEACVYTLTLSNAAGTPATATGTLNIVPTPVLASTSLTPSPAAISGGASASISMTLPALSSVPATPANTVSFAVNCGSGSSSVNKTNAGGGAVVSTDLATPITFNAPATSAGTTASCVYTLTVANAVNTKATATGTLSVVAVPAFGAALSIAPNVILGGTATAGLLQFALPALSTGAASSVALTVAAGAGAPVAITKSGGAALAPADLGTTVSIDPPSTQTSDPAAVFTYSLTATNSVGGVSGTSAPATDLLNTYPPSATLGAQRIGATATLLPDGTVLIAGGGTTLKNGACGSPTASAELYNPATGATTALGTSMTVARCDHTATLVGNKVYLMGGGSSSDKAIDIFDTTGGANTFQQTSLPALLTARTNHTATALGAASGSNNNGSILVVGGYTSGGTTGLDSLELYTPGSNKSVAYTGKNSTLFTGRADHTATLIGKWLFVIGGNTGSGFSVDAINSSLAPGADNPINNSGVLTNAQHRQGQAAIALSSTSILVIGGLTDGNVFLTTAAVQVYTVDSNGNTSAISAGTNLATGIARFSALLGNAGSTALLFGGTTAMAAGGDTATNAITSLNTATGATASYGALSTARQDEPAVNLQVAGASNLVFLVAGGGAAGSADLVLGP